MIFQNKNNFNNCIGHHTILYGETNTKKTYYTAEFVKFLLEKKEIIPEEITILDFAPEPTFLCPSKRKSMRIETRCSALTVALYDVQSENTCSAP